MWRFDFRHQRSMMYASEIIVADLNKDNQPELIFTTYGAQENITPYTAHGYLMILDNAENVLFDIELYRQGTDGNGKGAPAAPTVMDTDNNGSLEILVQTFGEGLFIYSVPGSAENQLLWPTARGNYLRDGMATGQTGSGVGRAILPAYLLLLQ